MKKRFATAVLLTWFAIPALAGDWVERKNQEVDPARPLGWRFEIPPEWKQASVPEFPYPLGESWKGGEGDVSICWLGNADTVGLEQLNLESRGYEKGSRRVAGRDASTYQKKQEVFCYVNTPKGYCRIQIHGPNPMQQKILQSFTVIHLASVPVSSEQRFADWSFLPPPGWQFRAPDLLLVGEDPVCRLTSHSLEREVMPRGWARNQAGQQDPKLKERLEMEPFSSKRGVDGYLVEWKGPQGPLVFGYAAREQKGLRVELLRSSELDRLRRMLDTLRYAPGPTGDNQPLLNGQK